MTYCRVVVTCGVSVFGSANAFRKWTEDKHLLTFPKGTSFPNPEPPEGITAPECLQQLRNALAVPGAVGEAITDQRRVSAEYSSLLALKREKLLADEPTVVLVHTDTLGGRAAVAILSRILEQNFKAIVECSECRMNVDNRDQLRYDLGDFMQKVAVALRDHDKNTTCFFPLGGYKVMTSLGSLAGGYFGFPTLYLHEEKQIFHEIPGVPWKMSGETLSKLAPLMKKVGSGAELPELLPDEQQLLREYSWLFERAGEIACVNSFGLFLMEEHPELFGTKFFVAEDIYRDYRNDGRKKFILQQLGVLSAKLAAGSTEADLEHERDWSMHENDGWHLYKGASNGQQCMRAVYRWEKNYNRITIKNLWTSHDYVEDFKAKWNNNLGETVEWPLQ